MNEAKRTGAPANWARVRDDLEGYYTETDPETAEVRTVHGQYTHSADSVGPDPDVEGDYTGTDHGDGEPPTVHEAKARMGNYPKAEH